jgi:hypothetical protein
MAWAGNPREAGYANQFDEFVAAGVVRASTEN